MGLAGCASTPSPQPFASRAQAARRPAAAPARFDPDQAAAYNRAGLQSLPFDLFGRPEQGWAVYAPRVMRTVDGGRTLPSTPAFAEALARWQVAHDLPRTGEVDTATLLAMKAQWQAARPFLAVRAQGVCPDAPAAERMQTLDPGESPGGRGVQLRDTALQAYRRMVAAARAEQPALAARPDLLTVFSGYRSPEHDAERCAIEGNCQGVVRAACSAHRTGLAMDLTLDTAPGYHVDSTADVNRLTMSRGLAYRWLVANAARFGFVNYGFEPWHWEWTGEAP